MSEPSSKRSKRPDERVQVSDSLGIVLTKADGTIITNEPQRITVERLEKIAEEAEMWDKVVVI